MYIGADGVLYGMGVVLCEQVGGERGLHHIAVGADPCAEEDWRNDEVPILCKLVGCMGRDGAGDTRDGRLGVDCGAILLDGHRESVEQLKIEN